MTKPFQYQRQDSELTLKEGLAEYYEGHPGLFRPSQLPKDSARFFRSHDIAHVVTVWLHTRRMTSKWPWEFNEAFMDACASSVSP